MRLQDLCRTYNIRFKKALGQNLLLDDNINRIMVDAAALTDADDVLEVGAGLGALTSRLHPLAGRVLAVEIDPSFMPCLEDRFGDLSNVTLFRGDILNHEVDKLLDEFLPDWRDRRRKVVANLPYYITTPILFHFWESDVFFDRFVVMVQEEVAQRMVSVPGKSDYGVLSIAAQLYAETDLVHRVPASCFRPQPKVDSCIVRMRNRETPRYPDIAPKTLLKVVRAAFAQRRKTLRNALSNTELFGLDKNAILASIEAAGIDGGRRPQTLTSDEYATLAREALRRADHPA